MKLFEEDQGKELSVLEGEEAEIILFENPSTGFRWAAETTEGIEVLGNRYEKGNARVGSSGHRHFLLRFRGTGRQIFRGWYRRSWEENRKDRKGFEVSFLVKGQGS